MKQPSNDDAPTSGLKHAMPDDPGLSPRRLLEPNERIAEVIFGLIMVLTFTGSLSIAEADRADVRIMLIGALGCNVAWGLIDGVLYLMGCLNDRERGLAVFRAVQNADNASEGRRLIANALPPIVASVLQPLELEALHERLRRLPEPDAHARLQTGDWLGAAGVFLWVFLSTFPVAIPFLVIRDAGPALRVSNAVAVAMLFTAGYAYGRCIERRPWVMGVAMILLGCALVGLTMALGG